MRTRRCDTTPSAARYVIASTRCSNHASSTALRTAGGTATAGTPTNSSSRRCPSISRCADAPSAARTFSAAASRVAAKGTTRICASHAAALTSTAASRAVKFTDGTV
jgi:hypothetical protein